MRHFVNEISLSLLLLMNWFDGFTCLIRGKQKLINSPWFLNTRIQFSVLTKNCVFCRDMLCFRWLNIIKLSKRFRMRVYIRDVQKTLFSSNHCQSLIIFCLWGQSSTRKNFSAQLHRETVAHATPIF